MIVPHIKQALVLGLGRSGLAAARLLVARSWQVTAVDAVLGESVGAGSTALQEQGVFLDSGALGVPDGNFAFAVMSPGIAMDHPWISQCRSRGIPLVSELELGWFFCTGKILAVTGSNGKTTLVDFMTHALNSAGCRATAAGNIGVPLSEEVMNQPETDWYVVEVSSFQLEHCHEFSPDIGVLINLNQNHLDRHHDMETYKKAKLRLFQAMTRESLAVIPDSMKTTMPTGWEHDAEWVEFGGGDSFRYHEGQLYKEGAPWLSVQGTYFDHEAYGENLAAACVALCRIGLKRTQIQDALQNYEGLEHRFERLGTWSGVQFINDSKATNLSATRAALRSADRPVHLIAGGVLKEHDVNSLKEILVRRACSVYLIGSSASELFQAWSPVITCIACDSLEQAVHSAWQRAQEGEAILLSPGCASFDQFNGYMERGERFKQLTKKITMEVTR